MLVLAGALRQTGLSQYLALWSAKAVRGNPVAILLVYAALALLFSVSYAGLLALPASPVPMVFFLAAVLASAALGLHVARGWQLSGTGSRGLLDLASAPRFALWKLMLRCRPGQNAAWIRTRRIAS